MCEGRTCFGCVLALVDASVAPWGRLPRLVCPSCLLRAYSFLFGFSVAELYQQGRVPIRQVLSQQRTGPHGLHGGGYKGFGLGSGHGSVAHSRVLAKWASM